MDDLVQVQPGHVHLAGEEDGAVACEGQSERSGEERPIRACVWGGCDLTFPAHAEVLHHAVAALVHHLSQVVHGGDGVITNAVQDDAWGQKKKTPSLPVSQNIYKLTFCWRSKGEENIRGSSAGCFAPFVLNLKSDSGSCSDLLGEASAAPAAPPPAETRLPATPTRRRSSAENEKGKRDKRVKVRF